MHNAEVKIYGEDGGVYLQCTREECREKTAGMRNYVPFEKWIGDTVNFDELEKVYSEHVKHHHHDHTCRPCCDISEEHMKAMEEDADRQLREMEDG